MEGMLSTKHYTCHLQIIFSVQENKFRLNQYNLVSNDEEFYDSIFIFFINAVSLTHT